MQACLVKCTPQPNIQDNSVQSSASYQIQQKQLAEVQLLLPETMWEERGRGGECVIQECEAGKGYFYLTKAMGQKKHRQRSLCTGNFQCCGQFSGDSVVVFHHSFHRAPTARSRLYPWPTLKTINLIYQVFTEMAYFFLVDLIVI